MDSSPSLFPVPRLRVTRHSQFSPLDNDLSRTPTAGPSRLHALHDENEDTDATPRLPVSSSLPSMFAVTEDTPAARLRALLAQVPNTTSASRTQLLHEPPPSLPSDRESDFDPPPRWANSSASSARESLKSLITHALRDPGDTPRKDGRRNSIDMSEVEDSPRNDRVIEERSRNKGKRTSFSDDEFDKSSERRTPVPTSYASNMEALRNRILSSHASKLSESMSGVSDSSTDNASELHPHPPGIPGTSIQTVQLSAHFQSHSNLLDQDSEMQRAMGAADSLDAASTDQESSPPIPPAPQMTVSSLAARPRSSLVRAGSLTEAKLTANASRRSQKHPARQDSCDSTSSVGPVAGNGSSVPGTPPRERHDSYHHHRTSHSLTGSPLPQEFPRQRYESTNSGGSRSSSRAESRSSIADFRDRMKDTEKERQHERERAWNRPVLARTRAISQPGSAGSPANPSSGQLRSTPDRAPHSRGHSQPSSPSESVRSRAAEEEEENYERERHWEPPHPTWHHQNRQPASPIPGPSSSRSRTQHISELHVHTQAQSRHVRRNPSQSSLHSESSSRPSSPADPAHRRQTTRDDEVGANHERERNWGSRQQTWNHTRVHKQAASPNPAISHSRVRTQSLESDSSAPATSNLTRLPDGPLKRRPTEPSSPAPAELPLPRHAVLPSEAHQYLEHNGTSSHPMSTSPRPKTANGYAHDKPGRAPSHLPRSDSPLAPSNVNGSVEGNGIPPAPAPAPHFGWQFPRSRPKLPDFEPDLSSSERSPSPVHRPTSHIVGSAKPSHIPVRSPGLVPKVEIKRNGDARSFARGHKRATTEFTEANGAVPPKIHFQPEPEPEPEFTSEPGNPDTESLRESDESMQDALTPVVRPIEIPPPEALPSHSPVENPSAYPSAGEDFETSTPSAALPLDTAPSFELSTPPRHSSLSTSKTEFQTPSPPKGLLELPGPPSSSEDDTGVIDILTTQRKSDNPLNLTTMKTPRPPGAWAATPGPARSQTPQPTSSSFASTKLSRARSNSLPQSSVTDIQPSSALSRAGTLPVRTPAPPGGWFSTPGSLRRKGLMKVRFENATSDSAVSDADTGAKDGRLEVPLPEADWDATSLPGPGLNGSESMSEPSFNDVKSSSPASAPPVSASGDGQEEDGSAANAPPETIGNPSTHTGSPPRRKSRRSSSVRLVDEYGHAKEEPPITPSREDVREHSASMRMPGGGSLKTPRSTSVRMLDAMGHEIDEPSEQNDSEDTVTEVRYSRQEALQRMKRAVADLREGLSSVDSSGNAGLDDPRLSELYDLSKAARDMRAQLASSLQQAQSAQLRHKYGSLKESMRKSRFLPNFLPESRVIPWNHWLFWTFFCFLQFVLFLVMYRMSRTHARHQFLTTYFDPFYADLHLHPNKPDYNYDTNLFSFFRRSSLEPSYPELLGIDGPIQYIRRNIADAVARVQRSVWESWGASGDNRVKAWPPT